MKQLEIKTNKRLLIVESENANEFFIMEKMPAGTYEIICKGSDLTEDIAKGLVEYKRSKHYDIEYYWDYKNKRYSISASSIESFISAIEAEQDKIGISIDISKSIIFEIL